MTLIIVGTGATAAGWPLFRLAIAWSAPGLLVVPVLGLCVMVLGFALSTAEESPAPRPSEEGRGEVSRLSDAEFDRLLDELESYGHDPLPAPERPARMEPFEDLVRDAIDELPAFVHDDMHNGNLAVLVSDGGDEWNALGLYMGGHIRDDLWARRILIFRDTLTRAYGDDPAELRRQVAITVRHEVAHFYGADEQKVHALGL